MTNSLPTTLEVHVRGADGSDDYALSLTDPDVTVSEVLAALDLPDHTAIDGRLVASPASTRAVEVLAPGSRLSLLGHEPAPAEREVVAGARVEVAIAGGLDAGPRTQLPEGMYRIGEQFGQPATGWYLQIDHPELAIDTAQPWHVHASSVEAMVGDRVVVTLAKPIDSEVGYAGIVHRPPRALPPQDVTPIEIVDAPADVHEPAPLSWATLLAPIPIALMMAFFFRPIFALFAAMGPVMAVGRWYESRRRFRRDTAERDAKVKSLISETESAMHEQREEHAQLCWLGNPHVAELWRRARTNSVRLWERRPGVAGYMVATVGVGPDAVTAVTDGNKLVDEIHAALRAPLEIRPVPHIIDLANNTGVGIHGERTEALAIARSVVLQLVSLHGPADLRIGVLCDPAAAAEWDWVKWLPHADTKLTAHSATPIVKDMTPNDSTGNGVSPMNFSTNKEVGEVRLIVVDDASADVAAIYRAAQLGDRTVRVIAVGTHPTLLPAVCSSLVGVRGGAAEVATPELTGRRNLVCPVGISANTAASWARSLTGLIDPEVTDFSAGRDEDISLLRLVEFESVDHLAARWAARPADADPTAVIGVSDEGAYRVNLTEDGPHALVAGTTGSGKSELLRTLVIGLAAECPPERLNFVLVDFKGGGAFDAVDRLPHVAGLITDLDETMVTRAISSLRAELHRRESLFRELGVSSYEEAVRRSGEPIARLLIVIDEFAALATDYPELMTSIIDLAARGRSLGMHLILATQRPSGVVDQKIRANTNLRVALRVQDAFDSQDVIGIADAANIDRKAPGRAIFSVGGDVPITVQTAYSGAPDSRAARCSVRNHRLFEDSQRPRDGAADGAPRELDVLVQAIAQVSASRNYVARPLWSESLPAMLDWIDLGARELTNDDACAMTTAGVALGLVDVPDRQTQKPWRWDPDSGPLALYGSSAECAGKSLVSLGAALASAEGPDQMHLYVIDGDGGTTAALAGLAHTGAYITLPETDRIERTVKLFEAALAERRTHRNAIAQPRLVLMIDNLAAVLSMYDDIAAGGLVDRLSALARDGSPQRLHLALTARTVRDVGHRLGQQIPNRLVLALADPGGYLTLGLKARDVVPLPDMRAMDLSTGRVLQLVEPPDLSSWSNQVGSAASRLAKPIRTFPTIVERSELQSAVLDGDGVLAIPVGIEAENLEDATLLLQPGEHALVVASNGMGRSTTIQTILWQLEDAGLDLDLVRVGPVRSPIVDPSLPGTLIEDVKVIAALSNSERDTILIVDGAEGVSADVAAAIEKLLDEPGGRVRIIAATTPDFGRSMRAWTTKIRNGGTGMMIGGTPADGELFKVRFGRLDGLGVVPGRGHLIVRGRVNAAQFAQPDAGT